MGDFKRSSGGSRGGFGGGRGGFGGDRGGRSSFGARKSFGGGDRGPVTMHKATCSECNETCEVPFRPTGEKPVYCSKCFGDRGGSAGQDRGGRRDFGRREETRFAPKYNRESSGGGDDSTKRQLNDISAKLDTLIKLLGSKE